VLKNDNMKNDGCGFKGTVSQILLFHFFNEKEAFAANVY
jgi:hypothetical protein